MSGRLANPDSSALVFITGATGYIGRRVVCGLLEDGERVHVLSRRQSDLTGLQGEGVRVFCGDVTDRVKLLAYRAFDPTAAPLLAKNLSR